MADRRPLMSLDEVLQRLIAGGQANPIKDTETVSTFEALGRILSAPVSSGLDVPPADNTSMDGYALRAADVPAPGSVLPVAQRIPAGVVGQPLQAGTAARIFTGAQVPPGADAIVMQEDCEAIAGEGLGSVRVNTVPRAGQWIRRRGEDIQLGSSVLARGARLSAQAMGLAASVGAARLEVVRRPRVALMSTGDELVMPGQPLRPGAIYNSNRYLLRGLLQAAGCEVTDFGIVPDRLDATVAALAEAAMGHDLILTSGGVSTGEEDHIRPAVQSQGWIENWQVAIKPGKPLAFGGVRRNDDDGAAIFMGLPGNPVSSFVNFLIAVAPVLRAMQGAAVSLPRGLAARADFDWPRADRRREFMRARMNETGGLELFGNQSSGVLTSAVWGDGLVDNPPGRTIARGDAVRFLPFAELIG
ncbi:MAG: molybdopterin molybdotransferase MoeA [Burkholderiales bacterium]|nr:molybdopterin molybdotransferase MoeA [Burkholderiales bacterium]